MSTEIAYLAGVVDSDGCIRVERVANTGRNRDSTSYAAFVSIQQVETEAIELAKTLFGGFVQIIQPTPSQLLKFKNPRTMFRWTAKSRIAAKALSAMRPYLRIKRRQADNAIELAATVRTQTSARFKGVRLGRNPPRHRTTEELARLESFHTLSRHLNSGQNLEL